MKTAHNLYAVSADGVVSFGELIVNDVGNGAPSAAVCFGVVICAA